jgi:serine/threonine protein kinase/CRP-like cAMP-binding protein
MGILSKPIVFGKYELIDRIAVGGMAEIFLARSASLGGVTRTCVIKRILPEYSADRQFVSMFIDEARITIGLDHPNIVRLFDFGQVDGTYFMAMEYVEGVDVVDVLRLNKRLGEDLDFNASAFTAMSMARGLHHAHVQRDYRGNLLGIVHRDVSPHNIFLSWMGDVKVGDFGIASAKNKLTVTQAGTVKGKFAYMSPEQATGGVIDARADVWACGVVMWEMLAGERLFAAESPVVTISRVVDMGVPKPSEAKDSVPEELERICMNALVRPLDQRYQTAAEMADDIEGYLDDQGYGKTEFASYLQELEWEEGQTTRTTSLGLPQSVQSAPSVPDGEDPLPSAVHRARKVNEDDDIKDLLEKLGREPDLWTLVKIGDRHKELSNKAAALSAYRTAAAVFAHRGLLVQAVCAYEGARGLLTPNEIHADLEDLGRLRDQPRRTLTSHLRNVDLDGYWGLLQSVDKSGLGAEDGEETVMRHPAPLFGRLLPGDFARLAEACRVRRMPVGEIIVREGDRGSSLFAVGRGRLVVHCLPGSNSSGGSFPGQEIPGARELLEQSTDASGRSLAQRRIYLSALADGDFFGEFSFLTGRPRSATVETIQETLLLEIEGDTTDSLLRSDPVFKEPLLEFYKDRVGELMLAKNPVFAVLSSNDRRELLTRAKMRRYRDEEIVVREGEVSEDMFFIKHGEVEVFREDGGLPIFINKLREGEFFGEVAALHNSPRTASVRAMGEVELFSITKTDLEEILSREQRVRDLFEAAIQWRSAETKARMAESRRIFEGI